MGDLPEPVLLPPRPSPIPSLLTGAGLAALAALGAVWFLTRSPAPTPASFADHAVAVDPAKMTGFLRPFDPVYLDLNGGESWSMVALPDAERKRLRDDVANKRMRLGVITVWDNDVADGDQLRFDSAGYSQVVTLLNEKQNVIVPVAPGEPVRITVVYDPGGGGVNPGAQTALGPLRLPTLNVGQYFEAIAP